jgi:hypothetical protein
MAKCSAYAGGKNPGTGNGGFNRAPNVGYTKISQERWDEAFPKEKKKEDTK